MGRCLIILIVRRFPLIGLISAVAFLRFQLRGAIWTDAMLMRRCTSGSIIWRAGTASADRLLKDATARKINMIAAWSVDRLGRSLQHLVGFLNELQTLNCHLYLHQQAIDTTTPSGRAMFQMCGVFAEFERAMIVERVNSGLARAKAKGVKLGRGNKKDGERSADEKRWGMTRAELEKRILRLYKGGTGLVKIGKTLGIGTGLVQRVITEQPRPFAVDVAEAYS